MIGLHEAFLIERIEVKHPIPNRRMILTGRAVGLERDIRHRVMPALKRRSQSISYGFFLYLVLTHLATRWE